MGAIPSDDMTWGAATAAYQVEGAAREDGRGESIWDRFCRRPGAIEDGSSGDVACDHYHRWREDIGLMRELGLGAYRFSVSWPRILPDGRGRLNEAGLAFYDRLVDGLLEAGIEPWVTLYHWDLPQALEDAGGWPQRTTAEAFGDYADVVARRLGDRVRHWITMNEPWVSANVGYGVGEHAPGRADPRAALRAGHHLLLGHARGLEAVRAAAPNARVGIALSLTPQEPAADSEPDRAAATLADGRTNRWFLDPLAGRGYPSDVVEADGLAAGLGAVVAPTDLAAIGAPIDFVGVNYYTRGVVAADGRPDARAVERTTMGWEVYPAGLRQLLGRLGGDYPFASYAVTENGAAFEDVVAADGRIDDPRRIDYLRTHTAATLAARAEGVPVEAYFCWSLLDNFEWARGYGQRFGLVRVDYATQRRTIKASGAWYRDWIAGQRAGTGRDAGGQGAVASP